MNNTNSSDNSQEVAQSINTDETSPSIKEVTHEEKQAPLMRYFSIADESTESYVLGYN